MEIYEVLTNLKGFDCWDFKNYSLSKAEADAIIDELERPRQILSSWRILVKPIIARHYYRCDNCNCDYMTPYYYCPNCGAKMVGGNNGRLKEYEEV